MKRAVVLSGGGSKGAYQMGFWKAIRELKIDYDIVTGTSIGAINGALMAQKSYHKAYRLWNSVSYSKVLSSDIKAYKNEKKMLGEYAKGAFKGGLDANGLEKTLRANIDPYKVINSDIDYGLVTVKFPSLKPTILTKNKIKENQLIDYLLASSACFPALKMKNIDEISYIDGGYYDNMPINLAIKMGATEVIAVDLKEVGHNRKVSNKSVKLTIISPRNDIGNFLIMEKDQAKRAIDYGYNDTMKTFGHLEGDLYTFKKGSLKRNYDRIKDKFYENCNLYIDNKNDKVLYRKIHGKDKYNEFNNIIELLATNFEIDDSVIYRVSYLNAILKRKYNIYKLSSYKDIKKKIKLNKLSKKYISREMICYMYDEISKSNYNIKLINSFKLLFPNSFLCAIYLKSIL